jgi:tRNA 2-selenouridine synthase SelU
MLFLIEYARNLGKIVSFKKYEAVERETAQSDRLVLELYLRQRGEEHEVVLLEAASEEALRRTHARYFEDLSELVRVS